MDDMSTFIRSADHDKIERDLRPREETYGIPSGMVSAPLSWSTALLLLKIGHKVARTGWNGKGMWLKIQWPDANSFMTEPYIYIEYPVGHPAYPNGSRVPWLASQTDQLREDWVLIP